MLPITRTIIPDVVRDQRLAILPSTASVSDAAKVMAERRMGAVLVVDKGALVGIVTERDIAVRVVAVAKDARATKLADVMTAKPDTLKPTDTVRAALDLMARRGYRHLPVLKRGKLVGMVSIRDLYRSVVDQLEADILMLAEGLVQG